MPRRADLAQAPGNPIGAKTWIGHAQEMEDFIKGAEVASMKGTSVGVTHPNHAILAPGGPVSDIAWKPLKPGRYEGYFESYKSEIAAYEVDKLLGLNMVPPTVEKRVNGDLGAAVMWVKGAQTFKEMGGVPGQKGVKGPPAGAHRLLHEGHDEGEDVRQPHRQHRSQPRELAPR